MYSSQLFNHFLSSSSLLNYLSLASPTIIGLDLPPDQRNKLKENQQRLAELKTQFSKNVNEDKTNIELSRDELEGMPEDFFAGREKKITDDGAEKFIVTMKYPDLFPVLKMAKREETRRRMDIANSTRCKKKKKKERGTGTGRERFTLKGFSPLTQLPTPLFALGKENIPMLEEAVKIRRENAKLLGYNAHTEYRLEVKMAKTEENVLKFLAELKEKLKPLAEKEIAVLKDLKKQEKEANGEVYDGTCKVRELERERESRSITSRLTITPAPFLSLPAPSR